MSTAEIYDPAKQTVSASPANDSRFKLPREAVQLSSGQSLFAGGSDRATNETWIYYP